MWITDSQCNCSCVNFLALLKKVLRVFYFLVFFLFSQDDESEASEPQEERDDLINPYWVEDSKNLGRGEIDYLSGAEVQFWKDLIDKYLFPLDADSKKQVTFKSQPWVELN